MLLPFHMHTWQTRLQVLQAACTALFVIAPNSPCTYGMPRFRESNVGYGAPTITPMSCNKPGRATVGVRKEGTQLLNHEH